MPAIGRHKTATSERAWSGPTARRNLRNDGSRAYYRSAFAWQEGGTDGTRKAHFRFIHHFVASGGAVGAASTRAASTGIAVLNGGRGGTTIPSADRRGVHSHLAGHLRDAGKDVPPLLSDEDYDRACKLSMDDWILFMAQQFGHGNIQWAYDFFLASDAEVIEIA